MRMLSSRPAVAMSLAAAFSLTATPALADGWAGRHGHYRHHRGGIDGGDLLAAVLILGGIAAIAAAASKDQQRRRDTDYRDRESRYPGGPDESADYRDAPDDDAAPYGERRTNPGDDRAALNEAVDSCVAEIERGSRRVESVDSVRREGGGWQVEGLAGGREFSCAVDEDGEVRRATIDGRPA